MPRRGRVAVSITADNSGAKRGIKDTEKDLGHLQRVGVSSSRGLSAGFKAAGSVIAGVAIADQIRQTVVAAEESEVSQRKLQATLNAVGISYRAHAKEIDAVIQKTSKLAGLDDEDLQDAFGNIVRSTGSVSKGLELTGLAADLARAKHIDVAKAGETVAKVFNGNVGVLKRLGIAIDPVTTAQDKLKETTKHATVEQVRAAKQADKTATSQKALGELQKRLGGQAEAYGKTAAGAQDRFRVAVENLREKLGSALLPVIAKVSDKAATFIDQMSTGEGAGGRFAAKLKEIADRLRPIAKFFGDHPKLIAVAVGAWVAYRAAAVAALAITRLKLIGQFTGLKGPAARAGATSGAAFGTAASAGAATTFGGSAPGKFRGLAGRFAGPGKAIGAIVGTALIAEIVTKLHDPNGGLAGIVKDIGNAILPLQPRGRPSGGKKPLFGVDKDGHLVPLGATPSASPTAPSTPLPAPKRPSRRPSGASQPGQNAPRARASIARVASVAPNGVVARISSRQPDPDDIVAAVEAEADRIDRAHVPYLWGGGHDRRRARGETVVPMDCSGAVSAALGIDPRVSGQFVTWGSPGDGGSRGITIYANATHVLMKINGRFWGTSRTNPGRGPGWIEGGVSSDYLKAYTARHLEGTTGAASAGRRKKTPTRLTAVLGKTVKAVPGRGVTGHFSPATSAAAGMLELGRVNDPDYQAAFTSNAAAMASLTPGTNDDAVARNMRLFGIGLRISWIDGQLRRSGLPVSKRTALLNERAGLVSEAAGLQQDAREDGTTVASVLEGTGGAISGVLTPDDPTTRIGNALQHIDDLEYAGEITPEQAAGMRHDIRGLALSGQFGPLSDHDRLQIKGDDRAATTADQQKTLEQINAKLQAQLDLMKQSRDEQQRRANVAEAQTPRFLEWLSEVASGHLGGKLGLGFQTPGYAGGVARP